MDFGNLNNQYSISKTLRFELIPQRETLKNINQKKLVSEDLERSEKYRQAKNIIDVFHKFWLNHCLKNGVINTGHLAEYYELYKQKPVKIKDNQDLQDTKNKILFSKKDDYQKKLRECITKIIKPRGDFKDLNNTGSFFKAILNDWSDVYDKILRVDLKTKSIKNPKEIISEFNQWGTYFTGFNESRKNIYEDSEISTAVAYRCINDNISKFFDNCIKIQSIRENLPNFDFSRIEKNLSKYLSGKPLLSFFEPGSYNFFLSQDGIDLHNLLLGGYSYKDKKFQGINELINLYGQKNAKYKNIAKKYKLKTLHKQILSDVDSFSFLLEKYVANKDLVRDFEKIKVTSNSFILPKVNINQETGEITESECDILFDINNFLNGWREYDASLIYIHKGCLTDISKDLFGHWSLIKEALIYYAEILYPAKKGKITEKLEKQRERYIKDTEKFSFNEINTIISTYKESFDYGSSERDRLKGAKLEEYFSLDNFYKKFNDFRVKYNKYISVQGNINLENKSLDTKYVSIIKDYMDAFHTVYALFKPFNINSKYLESVDKDENFYTQFESIYSTIAQVIPLYNKVRNYVTKKPYDKEKLKLNFKNSTLGAGWHQNKEVDNTAILLKKNNLFYLAVMDKEYTKSFKSLPNCSTSDIYEKMTYKVLPSPNKMLPKVFFSKKNIEFYAPDENILRIRNTSSFTKSGKPQKGYDKADFTLKDCHKMIGFYQSSIKKHPEWGAYGFKFRKPEFYPSIVDFYKDISDQGYNISFNNIDSSYIHQLVKEGKLYLFQIYNKDFSPKSKGKPNIHTIYWKNLFTSENLSDVVFQLNGGAEIFYRPKSITYPEKIWEKGHHAGDPRKKQNYPIIKDRRYTQDKFQFHVPITINHKSSGQSNINDIVNLEVIKTIARNENINIIGIDRGERHLAYYTVINSKGEILEQDSLNKLYNGNRDYDYHQKLDEIEGSRDISRKSWMPQEGIKNIKEGYLSQIVHKLSLLITKYNAIVVFEDLNQGFKRGRIKIEKQVYQNLEKSMIEKLNYLVFKDRNATDIGGALKGYQLSSKFESFKKLSKQKQSGILYYVPAYHTSKICPFTGFINLLNPKYKNMPDAVSFINCFDYIRYNEIKCYFEFSIDYNKFGVSSDGSKKKWIICSNGDRIRTFKNNNGYWESEFINLTSEFEKLFLKFDVKDIKSINLVDRLSNIGKVGFYKSFMWLLKMTLQMRNSDKNNDYLISPVANSEGVFFDSREVIGKSLPQDADANGAYHIALKGQLLLSKIDHYSAKIKGPITNREWYNFSQSRSSLLNNFISEEHIENCVEDSLII